MNVLLPYKGHKKIPRIPAEDSVETMGFEPMTSTLPAWRSSRLS